MIAATTFAAVGLPVELKDYQRDILSSVEALASAVRRGDWRAAEASDRAMREAVLALAASVEQGHVDEHRARETLVRVHGEHLQALEQARALPNTPHAPETSRSLPAAVGAPSHSSHGIRIGLTDFRSRT